MKLKLVAGNVSEPHLTHRRFTRDGTMWDNLKEVPVWMNMLSVFYNLQLSHIGTCILLCMTVVVGKGNLLFKCP